MAFNHLTQTEVAGGQWVYITAIVPEGYQFVGWTADKKDLVFEDQQALSTLFFMPENDVQIEARIKCIEQSQTTEEPTRLQDLLLLVPLICTCAAANVVGVALFVLVQKKKKPKQRRIIF